MSKIIGFVITGVTNKTAPFVILENERVKVNHYYFLKHPVSNLDVLTCVYSIRPYNPEMILGSPGVLTVKKGIKVHPGKYLESHIAYSEIFGYYDEKRKWRQLETAPDVGSEVYEPTEEELSKFFQMAKDEKDALFLHIGKVRGTNIPVLIDLNTIAKSHILIAGMTRAGKSSFIVNLAMKSATLNPRPRLLIFDKRNEYGSLTKYTGVKIIPYSHFIPLGFSPKVAADKLGLSGKDVEVFISALEGLNREELTRERLLQKVREEALTKYRREKEAETSYAHVERVINMKGSFLFEQREVLDIISEIEQNPILIIDFSANGDTESQHRAAADIVRKIIKHAMNRKGDFSVIICVEEAQYFAPEKGLEIASSPAQDEVKAKFIEGISQAGGYNIGFAIMTQRPAYVSKSIISQCNSVACFRLKSGNDQDAILQYTEYGSEKLRDYLPGLADHEALMWGLALPTPFPVVAELEVKEYPQKAIVSAKQAWQRMHESQSNEKIEIKKPEIEEPVT